MRALGAGAIDLDFDGHAEAVLSFLQRTGICAQFERQHRDDTIRIAKEIGNPRRNQSTDPTDRGPHQEKQDRCREADAEKLVTITMDRNKPIRNRIQNAVTASQPSTPHSVLHHRAARGGDEGQEGRDRIGQDRIGGVGIPRVGVADREGDLLRGKWENTFSLHIIMLFILRLHTYAQQQKNELLL